MHLLIGADPEVFVRRKGQFVSAHTLKCGTKRNPKKTGNGSVQVDGLALEFNTKPTDSPEAFRMNVRNLLEDLKIIATEKMPDAEIVADPVAHFDPGYLDKLAPKYLALGCDPDYNAYTGDPNPRPNGMVPFRTGSGHIHLGWGKFRPSMKHFEDCCELVQYLDFYVGMPSLSWDRDNQRRQLYGKAGAFRPKPYGVEYRTPSNAWLRDDRTIEFVFRQTKKAFEKWQARTGLPMVGKTVETIINDNMTDWMRQMPVVSAAVYGD